jgi:hypothetical protein
MRGDLLSDDISEGAIALARDLIDRFNLNGKDGDGADDEDGSSAIERATYMQVAPRVGLDPDRLMEDIGTFELHRSRLPTSLFETIVMDMDGIMGTECGPPLEKWTVRASSKSFAPVRIIYITLSRRPSKGDHNQLPGIRPPRQAIQIHFEEFPEGNRFALLPSIRRYRASCRRDQTRRGERRATFRRHCPDHHGM